MSPEQIHDIGSPCLGKWQDLECIKWQMRRNRFSNNTDWTELCDASTQPDWGTFCVYSEQGSLQETQGRQCKQHLRSDFSCFIVCSKIYSHLVTSYYWHLSPPLLYIISCCCQEWMNAGCYDITARGNCDYVLTESVTLGVSFLVSACNMYFSSMQSIIMCRHV